MYLLDAAILGRPKTAQLIPIIYNIKLQTRMRMKKKKSNVPAASLSILTPGHAHLPQPSSASNSSTNVMQMIMIWIPAKAGKITTGARFVISPVVNTPPTFEKSRYRNI